MSKSYGLYCLKHGHIEVKAEKPPLEPACAMYCPFCRENLRKPEAKPAESVQKWTPNYVGNGVPA